MYLDYTFEPMTIFLDLYLSLSGNFGLRSKFPLS